MANALSLVRLSLESSQYESKLRGAKKQFEDFAGSIGINMKKLTAFGIAAGVAASAINKMTSELSECITQSLELAKQSEGVRLAFERLNKPGLLDNLREATHNTVNDFELMKAAVKFNDFKLPVEELGTMLAFAQQKAKDTGQSVDYMVDSIVTGLGRKSLMILDNLGLSAAEIKNKMKETGDMTKAVGAIIREQMEKSGDYIETAAERAAQANTQVENAMMRLGQTIQPLAEAGTSMWNDIKIAALDFLNNALAPIIANFTKLGRIRAQQEKLGGGGKVQSDIERLKGSKHQQYLYNSMLSGYSRAEQRALEDYKLAQKGGRGSITYWQEAYEAAKNQRIAFQKAANDQVFNPAKPDVPIIDAATGKTTRTTVHTTKVEQTELQANQKKINDLTQEYVKISDDATEETQARLVAIREEISLLEARNRTLKRREEQAHGRFLAEDYGKGLIQGPVSGITTPAPYEGRMLLNAQQMAGVNAAFERANDKNKKEDKKEESITKRVGEIAGGIQSMTGGLESLGVVIPDSFKGVLSGVNSLITIVSGITTILTAIEALQTADTLLPFAHGGLVRAANGFRVPGNRFSGDLIPSALTSGELVLNRAQEGIVATALNEQRGEREMQPWVDVERIWLGLGNYLRSSGRGEIVTTS